MLNHERLGGSVGGLSRLQTKEPFLEFKRRSDDDKRYRMTSRALDLTTVEGYRTLRSYYYVLQAPTCYRIRINSMIFHKLSPLRQYDAWFD